MRSPRHEVGELIREIERAGGRCDWTGSGHIKVFGREGKPVYSMSSTPRDTHAIPNAKSALRRLGLLPPRRSKSMPQPMPSDFDPARWRSRVEAAIKNLGIPPSRFAQECGLSSASWSQMRSGLHNPGVKTVKAVMKRLGWKDWYGDEEAPKANGKPTATAVEASPPPPVSEPEPEPAPDPEPTLSPYDELKRDYEALKVRFNALYALDIELGEAMIALLELIALLEGKLLLEEGKRGPKGKVVTDPAWAVATARAWKALEAWTVGTL